jgi:transcriptional regulator with XRE-family HTH domain
MAEAKAINETLRLLRVFHDMSRSELVDKIGISPSFLSEIESGNKKITLDTLHKYSEGFQIPVSSLLFFSETLNDDFKLDKAKRFLSDKIIRILQWIEDKDDFKDEEQITNL